MKKTTIIFITLTILLFSCSEDDTRIPVNDSYANGQPKTTIYKTIDSANTYYEIKYDSLGRIKGITPYSNGQLNGTKVQFRNNLGVVVLLSYKDGKREGFTYEFYKGQQTGFKGESIDDKFEGKSTWYYKNGQPSETGIRNNGKKDGKWTEYFENGKIKAKGSYTDGKMNEDWVYWNSDGTIDTTKKE